jgi:hypothetical protein
MHKSICALATMVLASVSFAQDTAVAEGLSAFRLAPALAVQVAVPLGEMATRWDAYPSGGLACRLPTGIERLSVAGAAYAGVMHSATGERELFAVDFALCVCYDIRFSRIPLGVRPQAGIVSSTVFGNAKPVIDSDPFRSSESEFGLAAGVEPVLYIKRWACGVPVRLVYVLSAPVQLLRLDIGVTLGREF